MGYRFDTCGGCDADWCDCGCSSCSGEHVPTCIRCGAPTVRGPEAKRPDDQTWTCKRGCEPDAPLHRRPQLAVCAEDDCAREVAGRSMVATANDVYCSVLCAGKAAIKAVPRVACPACQDAPGVPRYGGACDEVCQAALEASATDLADRLDGVHAEGGW